MFHGSQLDILLHLAAQGHSQGLDATTDAKDRQLAVVGHTGHEQFGQVALTIDATQARQRFLTTIEGVDIGSTTEQQGINAVERISQHRLISHRRDNHRHATSSHYLFIVALTQFTGQFAIVACNTNNRPMLRHRKILMSLGQYSIQIKMPHL